jgi:hypothetical protein
MLTAAGDLLSSLLSSYPRTLTIDIDDGSNGRRPLDLTIDRPAGSKAGVSWAIVDGKIQLSSNDSTMALQNSADATALGFPANPPQGKLITASVRADQRLLQDQPIALHVIDDTNPPDKLLVINALTGSSGGISWAYNGKSLTISGPKTGLQVSATNDADYTSANALGFRGSDLDLEVVGNRLTLTSANLDIVGAGALADSSASVSRAASGEGLPNSRGFGALTFNTGIPEDLIVAVASNGVPSLRRIAANISPPPSDSGIGGPPMPDIRIKILSGGKLEILDPDNSSVSLAFRNWVQDKPVFYRGLSFTIHGAAVADDIYDIVTDPGRTADNRNALLIASMASKSIFGRTGGSFQDVYSNVTAKLGTTVNSAQMTAAGAAQQASDLKTAFESKTGVNLDSEASDLIRYQQAYSAAAQVVMAARDMFTTILRSF